MPGKFIIAGQNQCTLSNAKAFAEGRAAKVAGLSVGANPHLASSSDSIAWLAAFNAYNVAGAVQNRDMAADLPKV